TSALLVACLLALAAAAGWIVWKGEFIRHPATGGIAVLPFENLSPDPDNAYFAEGIQEEILTRLASIADLKVISHTSTQQYQSKPRNLREIAKQLGVANIPEAYDAYLRGLAFDSRVFDENAIRKKANDFYEQAVRLDPNFALAWARLSRVNASLYFNGVESTAVARGDAAKHALESAQRLA